jgi:carbamoyl-phosphate synthase large subunit
MTRTGPARCGLRSSFNELGFQLIATRGTARALKAVGLPVERVYRVNESRPNVVDLIKSAGLDLIINTPLGGPSRFDEKAIRRAAAVGAAFVLRKSMVSRSSVFRISTVVRVTLR